MNLIEMQNWLISFNDMKLKNSYQCTLNCPTLTGLHHKAQYCTADYGPQQSDQKSCNPP